jgi:hypothetical protein
MGRFLIEVSHEATPGECGLALELLLKSGSHCVSEAEWGCSDGVHKGWIIVDVDTKEEASAIVPPVYRSRATIVRLTKFTIENIGPMLALHNFDKQRTSAARTVPEVVAC